MSSKKHMLQAAAGNAGGGSYWITEYQANASTGEITSGVTVDSDDNIWTSAKNSDGTYSSSINKWDKDTGENLLQSQPSLSTDVRYPKIAVDSSGNGYMMGWIFDGYSNNDQKASFIKINANMTYGFCKLNYASSNYVTRIYGGAFDGTNFYLAGETNSSQNGIYISYDTSGNLRYDHGVMVNYNALQDVCCRGSSQYYVGKSGGTANDPGYMFAVSDNYSPSFQKHYDCGGGYYTNFSSVDTDGTSIFIGGNYYSPRTAFVIKTNSSGTVTWSRQFSNTALLGEQTVKVAATSDGGVYVLWMPYYGTRAFNIAKIDSSGNLEWSNQLSHTNFMYSYDIAVTSEDEPVVVGTQNNVHGVVAKLPPDGSGTGTYGSYTYATYSESLSSISGLSVSTTNQSVTALGGRTTGTIAATSSTSAPYDESTETI